MESRKFYRDGVEETIVGPIKVRVTPDGHTVESYTDAKGRKRYFATLAGSHWTAHGDSVASAVADALWKDPVQRPSIDSLKSEITRFGKERKISLNEFRALTGACLSGCRSALESAGKDDSPITAFEIRDQVSKEWGNKLISILGWSHD